MMMLLLGEDWFGWSTAVHPDGDSRLHPDGPGRTLWRGVDRLVQLLAVIVLQRPGRHTARYRQQNPELERHEPDEVER